MKKILQDLAYGELESLILSLGEKKFRVRQAYDGLMRGKKISQINLPSALRQRLLGEYEDESKRLYQPTERESICSGLPTAT